MALLTTKVVRFLGVIIKSSGIAWDTDGSGDIGSTSLRPRDIHLSRNLAAGGTGKFGTTVGVGSATPAASGAGVSFPGTQSASTDANTLDDYEEGTFTPGVAFGGAAVGVTYAAANSGSYTKIGRMVFVVLRLILTAKGSSTGAATITGLPFTVLNATANYPPGSISSLSAVTFADFPTVRGESNTTTCGLQETTNAGVVTTLADTDFANTSEIHVSLAYQTA